MLSGDIWLENSGHAGRNQSLETTCQSANLPRDGSSRARACDSNREGYFRVLATPRCGYGDLMNDSRGRTGIPRWLEFGAAVVWRVAPSSLFVWGVVPH